MSLQNFQLTKHKRTLKCQLDRHCISGNIILLTVNLLNHYGPNLPLLPLRFHNLAMVQPNTHMKFLTKIIFHSMDNQDFYLFLNGLLLAEETATAISPTCITQLGQIRVSEEGRTDFDLSSTGIYPYFVIWQGESKQVFLSFKKWLFQQCLRDLGDSEHTEQRTLSFLSPWLMCRVGALISPHSCSGAAPESHIGFTAVGWAFLF